MRIPIESVEKQRLSFLWYPFVPFGVPTVFQGQAGYGKTTIISKIMAELSHGVFPPRMKRGGIKGRCELTEWQQEAIAYMLDGVSDDDVEESKIEPATINGMEIDGIDDEVDEAVRAEVPPMDRPFMRPVGDPIKSVYISRENHYGNIIRAKYEEFGGLSGFLSVEDESEGLFTTTVENIRKLTGDAKLVVIDPIFPFIEGRLSNNEDVARAMHNFDIVARETGAAYILMNNLTKSGSSADIDAGMGASNLKNIARSLFKLDREGNILYLESVKNNNSPARGRIGVLFDRLGRPDYIKYAQLEAAVKEMGPEEGKGARRLGKETQRAIDFLEEILADGPVHHKTVKEMAKAAGISTPTLNRAKQLCGRNSKRISKDNTVWR